MARFTDAEGREWPLEINIPLAKAIKRELDVDILDVETAMEVLARNPVLLCDVLYLLVKRQADERGLTDEDFGNSLRGEALEHAQTAFLQALSDFSPPRQREILTAVLETWTEVEESLTSTAIRKIRAAGQRETSTGGSGSPASRESSVTSRAEPSAS